MATFNKISAKAILQEYIWAADYIKREVLKADTETIKSDNLVMGIKTPLDITSITL